MPPTSGHLLAHGLGGRTDLPLDAAAAIAGGGIAVLASFLALTVLWRRPRLHPDAGRPLPARLAAVLRSRKLTRAARTLTMIATVLTVVVAFTGPAETERNLAPWALYVTFWVGLAFGSALLGPVWRRINPLRTLHAVLCRLTRTPADGRAELPARLGHWPAAGWLAAFVWLELVAPGRADPRLVGALICGYAAVNLALAWWYGRDWFATGDGFEAYSTLLARLAPLGARSDGTLVLRTPLTGLTRPANRSGLTALACVLIGSTGFDGITRTSWWRDSVDPQSTLAGTLGLAGCIAAVTLLYVAATALGGALTGDPATRQPGRYAVTLLPIAFGYTLAHYFSFFMLEGQLTFILASDPFGTGLDLLGSTGNRVDYTLVGPVIIALVQINAIVLGHIGATIAAHDLALRRHRDAAGRAQWPLAIAMVALTCAGLTSLLSG